jgi:hypothetical protein
MDAYGRPKVSATKVEIKCRWQTKRSQFVDADGKVIGIDAKVAVDRSIAEHSILWKGALEDWTAASATDYMEVLACDEASDVQNRTTRRVLILKRFGDTLPTTV